MGAKDLIKQKPKLEDLILSLDMLDDQSSVRQEEEAEESVDEKI